MEPKTTQDLCGGKRCFTSKENAVAVAKHLRSSTLAPVLCDACGFWHLNYTPRPRRAKRAGAAR